MLGKVLAKIKVFHNGRIILKNISQDFMVKGQYLKNVLTLFKGRI
jgi:hypothetical protein